jgi:glycosyltransferase involved in cell wall biosynthesis
VPPLLDAHHLGHGQTGNETWARNVVRELATRQSLPDIAVTVAGRPFVSTWAPERVHLVSSSSTRRLILDLPRMTRHLRPDALLVQYTLPAVGSVPGVVVIHDLSFERHEARAWIPARSLARYRATIRRSARRAAAILVPTEWTRTDIVERYGLAPEKVVVAGNAVDPDLVRQLALADPLPRDARVVLAVGTVLPRKNLETAARAVHVLRERGDDVRLRLVGPTSGGAHVVDGLRAILGDALEVVGPVSMATLAQEYVSADVLAFPSMFEGFGIPVIEAMAAGLPVVCSDATCLPEVGGDAVRFAGVRDVDAWVAALHTVLSDSSVRSALVARGRDRAAQFSWTETADRVESTLAAVAA